MAEPSTENERQPTPDSEWAFDGQGRLVDLSVPREIATFGPPPAVRWVAPVDLPTIFGQRCAWAGPTRVDYGLRCVSEVFESNGGLYVNVVDEAQWYRWLNVPEARRPERVPRATCIGARHLWIEATDQPTPVPEGDPQ